MASMRKMKGNKYYARIRWYLTTGKREEILIPLKTSSKTTARTRLKLVENQETDIVDGIIQKFHFKDIFAWLNTEGRSHFKYLTLKDIIPEYLKYRECVVRKGSAKRDEYSLKQLTRCLGENKAVQQITYKDIEQKFIPYYQNKGCENGGINISLRNIKVFFNYLHRDKLIEDKITFKMLPIDDEPCYINRAEIKTLHKMVDERMQRWFYFYEKTGCRARDPFKGYLDGDVWKITPQEAKTKHWHYYPLTDDLKYIWMELQDLRQSYEDKKKNREQAINSCYHLVQKNMWRAINQLKWSGVISGDKKLTLKSFRHTFGIVNVHVTGDINKVMNMMNHKRLQTTQDYLDMPYYLLAQEFPELKHLVDKSPNLQGELNPEGANSVSPLIPPKSNGVGNSGWVTHSDGRSVS